MDDLISRQAAIDEIKGFQQRAAEWRDEQEERSDIWHRADSAIASALEIGLRVKKLSSAQPDIARSIATIIENEKDMRVILTSVNQWTPCSERLPSEPFGCIVTVWDSTPTGEGDDFENILPYFVGWDGEQWNDGDGEQCPFEVIAWMPLPEPYKGDNNGESNEQ